MYESEPDVEINDVEEDEDDVETVEEDDIEAKHIKCGFTRC